MQEEKIESIINGNKAFIYKIINRYKPYYDLDDLYQVSCLGLIKAYRNFNCNFQTKFLTYAYTYIIGEIKNYIQNERIIKVSRHYYSLKKKIEEAREVLSQRMMRYPTNYELSCFLEIREDLIEEILTKTDIVDSLDQEYNEDTTLYNYLPSKNEDNIEKIYLEDQINSLTEEEKRIILSRYYEGLSQQEIATILGVNQVQVSRSETKILKKIKKNYQM